MSFKVRQADQDICVHDGAPDQGGRLICELPYQKKSIWNTYQAETWKLPERFVGEQTVAFVMQGGVQMKGFRFERDQAI